jgi:UDP-glucuronate 4-epimerase
MRALVTGAAGFVGSLLSEQLTREGHSVRGVDCFTPYYDVSSKHANLSELRKTESFRLVEADLVECDLDALLDEIDVVFHLAGQPGVRLSWADQFPTYERHNVLATQRLLEASRGSSVQRFVYASSSSLYGNPEAFPTSETSLPRPYSPYGVTKLAAEHLCALYAANWQLSTVSLRFFTVYGPRQRPDMAIHRLIEAALTGESFGLFGNGEQIRDFTFVGDVVRACVAAGRADVAPGTAMNIAGGSSVTVNELIALVSTIAGCPIATTTQPSQPGDVARTGGTIDLARQWLDWEPQVSLHDGIVEQVRWHRARRTSAQ